MTEFRIYLSGAISKFTADEAKKWRDEVSIILRNKMNYSWQPRPLDIFNPMDYYSPFDERHFTEHEVFNYELNHVRDSNLVIVNLKGINNSIGSALEIYEAFRNHIPVIGYFESSEDIEDIHPWIGECLDRIEDNTEDLVDYVSAYYF